MNRRELLKKAKNYNIKYSSQNTNLLKLERDIFLCEDTALRAKLLGIEWLPDFQDLHSVIDICEEAESEERKQKKELKDDYYSRLL